MSLEQTAPVPPMAPSAEIVHEVLDRLRREGANIFCDTYMYYIDDCTIQADRCSDLLNQALVERGYSPDAFSCHLDFSDGTGHRAVSIVCWGVEGETRYIIDYGTMVPFVELDDYYGEYYETCVENLHTTNNPDPTDSPGYPAASADNEQMCILGCQDRFDRMMAYPDYPNYWDDIWDHYYQCIDSCHEKF